jgi:hypothetical protein
VYATESIKLLIPLTAVIAIDEVGFQFNESRENQAIGEKTYLLHQLPQKYILADPTAFDS